MILRFLAEATTLEEKPAPPRELGREAGFREDEMFSDGYGPCVHLWVKSRGGIHVC